MVEEGLTTDGGGAGGKGAQRGDRDPQSQGDAKDLEGQGGADGAGDRGAGEDPESHGGARASDDECEAREMEEPDRARRMEG